MLLPLSAPPPQHQPGCPVLPSLPLIPALIVHVCYACQMLCWGCTAVRLDHQKVTMQDQSQLCPVSWFQLLTASNKKTGNRIWTEARREMKRGGRRRGGVCMASYSYLALSPILTPSLACTCNIDNARTSFSTGSLLFKPPSVAVLKEIFPLHSGFSWKKKSAWKLLWGVINKLDNQWLNKI